MKAVLITSSILIVLIAALRPLLRGRIDPRIQYALWLMVALRLLVPMNFVESTHSVLALLDQVGEPAQIVESIGQTTIPVRSYDSARTQVLEEYRRKGIEEAALTPSDLIRVDSQTQELMRGPTLAEIAAKYARPLWFGGAAVMAAWFLLVNLRLRRRLRGAEFVEVDCPLPVYVSDALPSPCLYGVVRPAVCVTLAALESEDRLRHVLAHELTHYRHKDHWWALVRCLCLCVYWFDPLVWWAAALSRQDCELACDEGAIRCLGEGERLPYGRTLVDMIVAGRTSLLQTATTMTAGKRRMQERIKLIARKPKTLAAAALGLALIVGCAMGCTFTGVPEVPVGPEESRQPGGAQALSLGLTTDSLQERLMDVPEELQSDVVSIQGSDPTAVVTPGDPTVLVQYWMNRPWADYYEVGMGWLLSLYKWDQAQFEQNYDEVTGYWNCFAKDENFYYVTARATDMRAPLGETEYGKAFDAIRAYAEQQVLTTEGVEPFDGSKAAGPAKEIRSVVDRLMVAPSVELSLGPAGSSRVYAYPTDPSEGFNTQYLLESLLTSFRWEYAGYSTSSESDSLRIAATDGSASLFVSHGSFLLLAGQAGEESHCYKAQFLSGEYGEEGNDYTPFDCLRMWFDEVELARLRVTTVPDRGQSHQEVVAEWINGFEGAYTKCASGSEFACTYVKGIDVEADRPDWMSAEELEDSFGGYGFVGEDFGKTWFGFRYSLVFVPENEKAKSYMMAGNTHDYEWDDAPEGALVYTRMGFMQLIDGYWVCEGAGTSW